jgi:hypothetical protein
MYFARRPKLRFAPSNSRRVARSLALGVALAGAAFVNSCILNPQPHPPSDDDDSPPPAGGRGGRGVGGAGGSTGGTGGGAGAGASGAIGGGGGIATDAGAGSGGAAGSSSSDAAGDSGDTPGPCRAARDCAFNSACFADNGTCAPVPKADCVPPASEGGSSPRLAACSAASACADGLTCVPLTQVLGSSGVYEPGPSGVCLTACNPCTPMECGLGETCFARAPGRGFCALALVPQGAPCGYAVTAAPCAAGLTCAEVFEQAGRTCVRHCRPDSAAALSSHEDLSASTSADCASGEVCFETASSSEATAASDFACVAGTLVDDAGACGGDRYCRPPARCTAGVCTP